MTNDDKRKISTLMNKLDEARNKAIFYLNKRQFRKSALHFNLEARLSDEVSEFLKELIK